MARPSLALIILVLALSAVIAAGAVAQDGPLATAPIVGTTSGEPNHLAINESEVRVSNTTRLHLDVGSSISTDSSSIRASYVTAQFETAYENVSTDEARAQVVDRTRARFENLTAELENRNQEVIRSYASGSITVDRFLRERGRITANADHLQGAISDIQNVLPRNLNSEFTGIDGRLEILQGSLSSSAGQEARSGGSGKSFYGEASDSGYTLASIEGRDYVRETYLGDEYDRDAPDQFQDNTTNPVIAVSERMHSVYPWVRDNNQGGGVRSFGQSGIYYFNRVHPVGQLTAYVDGGTTNVFREHQVRSLSSFNTTEAINRTGSSVRLTVNRTFETGPTEIRLYDTGAESPINGTVEIGNRDPIWLGDDGRRWIVEPRDGVQLNATAGTTRFSATSSGD